MDSIKNAVFNRCALDLYEREIGKMALPNLFDVCVPREDFQKGLLTESYFAADPAKVLRGDTLDEYKDPVRFFANTYPTRCLKNHLWNVCQRLTGTGKQAASIFRLDTN